tara:strand:- start:1326 stop:3032 length:1707 start_codon:yes stop_codon:yes gene_type:complete
LDTKLITRLSYEHIFNDNESIQNLIKKADVLKSLEVLALINKYEYKIHRNSNSEVRFIVQEWLKDVDESIKKKIVVSFLKFSEKNKKGIVNNTDFTSVSIINRISTLRLLEIFSSNSPNDIVVKDEKDNALIVFKLYLLVSDEISKRQDKVFRKYFVNKRTSIDEIHFHLFFGLTHPIINSSQSKWLTPEIFKFLLFEKWLRTMPHYYSMSEDYLKQIGLNSWYEYFSDVFSLSRINTESHRLSIKDYPVLSKVLNYFTSKNDFSPQWSEFLNLKKRPIIKLNENDYLILDFEFLLNKFFTSLYHDLLNHSKSKFGNKFSQDYNSLFIEDVLLHNTFKCAFGNSYIKHSEIEIKQHNVKGIQSLGLPDYYIRNGNKVFLFECKNSFISHANKIDLNTEALLEEIETKFYRISESESNKKKDKAIKQLVKYILNLHQNKYAFFDNIKNTNNIVFYPILLVTDYTLCSLGFNKLLNTYFEKEIESINHQLKGKIKPLTIIHIDDFLFHRDRLKKLDGIIIKYHNYLKNRNGFDVMVSFTDYLDNILFDGNPPLKKKSVEHILENSLLPSE